MVNIFEFYLFKHRSKKDREKITFLFYNLLFTISRKLFPIQKGIQMGGYN